MRQAGTAARFSTGGLRNGLFVLPAHPGQQYIKFCTQLDTVESCRSHIEPQHDVQRLESGPRVTKGFTGQPLHKIARIGPLEVSFGNDHTQTRAIVARRAMMNHEMAAALRAPQSKNG